MATRTPSATVRKRILAAIREVEKTGAFTNQSVLKYLQDNDGGGSMSDVQVVVRDYRDEAEAHAATMAKVPPMPAEVIELNEKVWNLIWKKADEPVAAIKAQYAAEIEKRKLRDEERDSDMLAVEADLLATAARAKEAETELAAIKQNLMNAKMEIARLEGRLAERQIFSFRPSKDFHEEAFDELRKDSIEAGAASRAEAVSSVESNQLDMFGEKPVNTTSNTGSEEIATE